MSPDPAEPVLLSLAPDAMEALRFARWHAWLPDLEGLEAEVRAHCPADAAPPRRLSAATPWHDTLAAHLTREATAVLQARYGAALRIEPDVAYRHQAAPMGASRLPEFVPAEPPPAGCATLRFQVTDPEDAPIAGVRLCADGVGIGAGAGAVTDAAGVAVLALTSENPAAVHRLTVVPAAGFWGRRLLRPVLRQTPPGAPARLNKLVLRPLRTPFDALPDWGMEAMGLDRAPLLTAPGMQAVRVAVLDPGAAAASPFTVATVERGALVEGWSAAGTALSPVAEVIGAAAPGARLTVVRIGPRPRASDLIAAVDWCLAEEIDLLDFGFAAHEPCAALDAALAKARAQGMVVVAPAGDSGGPVLEPAAGGGAIVVGALVAPGACPPEAPGAPGRFHALAAFSARGAALDVVAPGTGLVLPTPAGPAALEGTALASAFVTGFLARLLQTEVGFVGVARSRRRAMDLRAALAARCRDPGLPSGAFGAGLPVWDPLLLPGAGPNDCPMPTEAAYARARLGVDLPA